MSNSAAQLDQVEVDGYPELLRDLAQMLARALAESGIEAARAQAMAETVIEDLSDVHGGRQFYFPKANSFKARRRWLRMWDDFNGHNHAELSVKYGMNIKQVYRVLAIVREEMRRKRQGDLFSGAADAQKAAALEASS